MVFRLIFLSIFLSGSFSSWALDLKVRLYSDQKVSRCYVTPDSVDFYLLALSEKGEVVDTIYDVIAADPKRTYLIEEKDGRVQLKLGGDLLGTFESLYFQSTDSLGQFRISANRKDRAYYGELFFKPSEGQLLVINQVNLERYVAGVVESEAGHVDQLEFYKAQAVLARTFALKNLKKHQSEGYNLKDDVSSQVYFSKAHYTNKELIEAAVEATRDTVLVTEDCDLVLSLFHANSGGYTVNSEDVWLKEVDYLRAREDSFSQGVGSYRWEKRIAKERFYNYYANMFGVKNSSKLQKAILNFNPQQRTGHFEYQGKRLKLTKVRHAFGLRSTYFKVEEDGSEVVLKGKGFGHGVGLSQDGAIEMSRRGYLFPEILRFYFQSVELESFKSLSKDYEPLKA